MQTQGEQASYTKEDPHKIQAKALSAAKLYLYVIYFYISQVEMIIKQMLVHCN